MLRTLSFTFALVFSVIFVSGVGLAIGSAGMINTGPVIVASILAASFSALAGALTAGYEKASSDDYTPPAEKGQRRYRAEMRRM